MTKCCFFNYLVAFVIAVAVCFVVVVVFGECVFCCCAVLLCLHFVSKLVKWWKYFFFEISFLIQKRIGCVLFVSCCCYCFVCCRCFSYFGNHFGWHTWAYFYSTKNSMWFFVCKILCVTPRRGHQNQNQQCNCIGQWQPQQQQRQTHQPDNNNN